MTSILLARLSCKRSFVHRSCGILHEKFSKCTLLLNGYRSYRPAVKAVIFDMGGVILPSPLPTIATVEQEYGLPVGTINDQLIKTYSNDEGLWGALELGKFTVQEFQEKITTTPLQPDVIQALFSNFHTSYAQPFPEMIDVIKCLQSEGILVGLLTNNWFVDKNNTFLPVDQSLFDGIVESARVGCRKPGKKIFGVMLKSLGIEAEEAVFLDDMRVNVEAARSLGLQAIKVDNSKQAISELESMLDFPVQGYVPGSIAVKKKLQLDVESLAKYLKKHLDIHSDGNLIIRQFKHGQSNPTYYIKCDDAEFVLRKKPPGELLPSAHAVEREYRVMKAMHENGVPVPKPLVLCEDASVLGTPFYIMEYVRGRILKDPSLPGLTSEKRKEIYHEMNRVLAKIHQVNIQKSGLEDFGKHGNYVKRQTETWRKQYRASKTHEIKEMDHLISWLRQHVPASDKTTVVHGDFRIDNLVFDPDQPKVKAVLDWELSTLGDPISDVAYNCLPYYLSPKFPILKGFSGVDIETLGIPSYEDYVREYCDRMNTPLIDNWNMYMAFSFFRVAAILQGVYKRSMKGQESSADAKKVGLLAENMAKTGWSFAKPSLNGSRSSSPLPNNKRNYSTSASCHSPCNERGLMPISVTALPDHVQKIRQKLRDFMESYVYPNETILNEHQSSQDCWNPHPLMEDLKAKAKEDGLWNLFIPIECDPDVKYGAGLTNVEYAFLCEDIGRSIFAPEMFNCSAPDTGNMEVLIKYGSQEQKETWLEPLLEGNIRSCFAMTEPGVASSDATNIQSKIELDGDSYVINGRKWWTSGALDPRCKLAIFMGKTDPSAARHKQQSMILIPFEAPGVKVIRPLDMFGYFDPPCGHGEVEFNNVRVPKSNLILGPGRGFEIAQGRLGPGRIHHCMRLIGHAERSLELMIQRVKSRVTFGKTLVEQGKIIEDIANSRIEIEQARLLTLKAAYLMDTVGNKVSAPEIAMIKVVAPTMAQNVIDRAIQAFGGAGVSSDFPLAHFWAYARILRLADGPDEIHRQAITKMELKRDEMRT